MDKYTFEQLLRQQRTAIGQGFAAVLYAVFLGITANQFFESLRRKGLGWPFWIALVVTVVFLVPPFIAVIRAKKSKLTVKEMSFTALLLFDQEAKHHEPIQMANYDLSIWANNDWVELLKSNQQLRQDYLDSEAQQMDLWGYRQDLDYQLQIQYLEYAILRVFCGLVGPSAATFKQHNPIMSRWLGRAVLPLVGVQRRLRQFLSRYPYWQARFQQANRQAKVTFYFGDYPISALPEGLKNNLWLQSRHAHQQDFERQLQAGAHLTPSGYVAFTLDFPFQTRINHVVTVEGRQTTFVTDYGEMSLGIREHGWAKSGLREALFFAPRLRSPRNTWRESQFEVKISFSINQFRALWPWYSDEFSKYYGWAEGKLRAIEDSFSWDKYRTSVSRDDIRRLDHALNEHANETFVEMYYDFPATIEGQVAKYLRWTHSLTWQYRRDGLKGLVEIANDVSDALVEEIVLRLLQMSEVEYDDIATPLWVTEALGVYGPRAKASLAKRVYEQLSELAESRSVDERKGYDWAAIGKALAQMQTVLPHQSQLENAHRIVQQFLYESIPGDEEVADLLWASSSADVRQEMLDFISTSVSSDSFDDIRTGVKYTIALKRQLSAKFQRQILFGLIEKRLRRPQVRRDVLWLAQNLDDLEAPDQEAVIRHVLKESRSAYPEVQETAVNVLFYQAMIYGKSSTRIRSMITRRLIALADSGIDQVAAASVAALARFASFVPPRYRSKAASILMSQMPPRREIVDRLLQFRCQRGLEALSESVTDDPLRYEIVETLNQQEPPY